MSRLLIALFLILAPAALLQAAVVSNCTNLSAANTVFTLNQSVNMTGATCFNVTAQNVTLDCAGASVRGSNASNTFGIYSNQPNTTVQNCNISNFQHGIYFSGSSGGAIEGTNSSTTRASGYGIYLFTGSNRNRLAGVNATSSASNGRAIYAISSSNNTLANLSASGTAYAILLYSISDNNTLANITVSSSASSGAGVYLYTSSKNALSNITASITGANSVAIWLYNSSNNNTLADLSAVSSTSVGGDTGIGISTNSNYNTVSNAEAATVVGTAVSSSGIYNSFSGINATASNLTDEFGDPVAGTAVSTSCSHCSFSGINASATVGGAFSLHDASNCTVSGLTATSTGNYTGTISLDSSSNNTFSNLAATNDGENSWSLYLTGSSNNAFSNLTATANGPASYALRIVFGSNNTTIANSSAASNLSTVAFIASDSNSNTLINTTLSSPGGAGTLLSISADSDSNIFCLDNFSSTGSYYASDASGANFYNCTYGGKNQGNIWHNVMNGSVAITGTENSSIPGLYLGTTGSGYPYNSTNAQGKLSGTIVDHAPLTPFLTLYANLTVLYGAGGNATGNASDFVVPANRTINATPSEGYTFGNWSESGNCTAANASNANTTIEVRSGWCNATASFAAVPTATQATGGSSYISPSLSQSFNCSSGMLSIRASSGGEPVQGMEIRLFFTSETGYTPAYTDSDGIASFNITRSGRYSAENRQMGGYFTSFLSPFALAPCALPQQPLPANASEPQPPLPENATQPPQPSSPSPQVPASPGQGQVQPPSPSSQETGKPGQAPGSQSPGPGAPGASSELPGGSGQGNGQPPLLLFAALILVLLAASLAAFFFLAKKKA
ncbi:MAG: hypothetical protein WC717_02025 [Candidatus Micrarchaeia archaeon]